jgi:hypothetical protein
MNTHREVMQQALEALEQLENAACKNHGDEGLRHYIKSITALRAALAEPCDMGAMCLNCQPRGPNGECPDAPQPKAAPTQLDDINVVDIAEPIAWGMPRPDGLILDVICPEEHARMPGQYTVPLYKCQPKAEQEPVLVVEKEPDYWSGGHFYKGDKPHIDPTKVWGLQIGTKLYTEPQPAKREPLTLEEIDAVMRQALGYGLSPSRDDLDFARAIEAAVCGEKT